MKYNTHEASKNRDPHPSFIPTQMVVTPTSIPCWTTTIWSGQSNKPRDSPVALAFLPLPEGNPAGRAEYTHDEPRTTLAVLSELTTPSVASVYQFLELD